MKKYVLLAFIALFFVSSHSWAQYVKFTAENGKVSWIPIRGTINGTNMEISSKAINTINTKKGSIDLNEVWSHSTGDGMHYQVTSIGQRAFEWCSGLTSLTIPNSVKSISSYAFDHCIGLTTVTIPNSVTSIGAGAFNGCRGLTSIVVESDNSVYDSRNNCNAIIETASNTLIQGCMNTKILSSVKSIGDYAFAGCSGLNSVVIPSSVTSIGAGAFSSCSLISITSYITNVFETGQGAFLGCENTTLYVPKGKGFSYRYHADWNRSNKIVESIALAISCNNKGKVIINDEVQFTNDIGEVSVPADFSSTFVFTPEENCQLEQVMIDGQDVTLSVKNNHNRLITKVNEGSKMIAIFDKTGYDGNGDGNIDISDVVSLVNMILGQ